MKTKTRDEIIDDFWLARQEQSEACRIPTERKQSSPDGRKGPTQRARRVEKRITHPEVAKLNKRHFVVSVGGKVRVGTEADSRGNPIPLEYSTPNDFCEFYRNKIVTVDTGRKTKHVPLGRFWLEHPERRQFDRVVFDPSGRTSPNEFNIWKGYTVEPTPGDWSLLRDHIHGNICNGDEDLFQYVIGWMANTVRHPEKPAEVALVLCGAKGTGKGTFINAFGFLFGESFRAIANPAHLTGRFNYHLQQTILLLVDEGFWAGDKKSEGVLKQLITEPQLPIERKGYDLHQAPNMLHIVIASNSDWVVPASGLERRYCVLNVSDVRAQDREYFAAIWQQLESGGYEAMLHDLLKHDLSEFDVRNIPTTTALLDQMMHGLSPFHAWWLGRLIDGDLIQDTPGWGQVEADALYDDYLSETTDTQKMAKQQFGMALRKMMPQQQKLVRVRKRDGEKRLWCYRIPSLSDCRDEWDRQHAPNFEWPNSDVSGRS